MASSRSGANGLSIVRRSEVVRILEACTYTTHMEIAVRATAYVCCTEVVCISECPLIEVLLRHLYILICQVRQDLV